MDGWHGDDGLEKTVPESGTLAAGDDGDDFHPVAGRNRHPGKILRQERGPVVFHDDGFAFHVQKFQKPGDGTGFRQFVRGSVQHNIVLGCHDGSYCTTTGEKIQNHTAGMA